VGVVPELGGVVAEEPVDADDEPVLEGGVTTGEEETVEPVGAFDTEPVGAGFAAVEPAAVEPVAVAPGFCCVIVWPTVAETPEVLGVAELLDG
jgi:hypothetical protein